MFSGVRSFPLFFGQPVRPTGMGNDNGKGIIAVVFLVAGFLMGGALGYFVAEAYERTEAVKAGAGRFEANPATGETRFVYGAKS